MILYITYIVIQIDALPDTNATSADAGIHLFSLLPSPSLPSSPPLLLSSSPPLLPSSPPPLTSPLLFVYVLTFSSGHQSMKEHDLTQWRSKRKQLLITLAVILFLHFYLHLPQPLFMQSILPWKLMYSSPLFQVCKVSSFHIF